MTAINKKPRIHDANMRSIKKIRTEINNIRTDMKEDEEIFGVYTIAVKSILDGIFHLTEKLERELGFVKEEERSEREYLSSGRLIPFQVEGCQYITSDSDVLTT